MSECHNLFMHMCKTATQKQNSNKNNKSTNVIIKKCNYSVNKNTKMG